MNFHRSIDAYMRDMRQSGRIRSKATERAYRDVLHLHAEDVNNRAPHLTGRDDVKRTLARWSNPNTVKNRRAVLVSFYDWTVEEGIRPHNPARQTRRPRTIPTSVYRLTRAEAVAMLTAANPGHEQRIVFLGICAGLRNGELRGMRGRNFQRPGLIHVSADIAKGGKERWVPVIAELAATVETIRATVKPDAHVLPRLVTANPGVNTRWNEDPTRPMSQQSVGRIVARVAVRAGIREHIHPHLLRHCYADHVARHGGLQVAQALLGHADVSTTQGYVGAPTIDELIAAVGELRFGYLPLSAENHPVSPVRARQDSNLRAQPAAILRALFSEQGLADLASRVDLYARHFAAEARRA